MSNELTLIERLLDGLAGWLSYQQSVGVSTLYGEYFLYQPIHDLAKGRRWVVAAQEQIANKQAKKRKKRGTLKTFDFVFFRHGKTTKRPGLLFLEIKFLKNTNKTADLDELAEDVEKLKGNFTKNLVRAASFADCGEPKKFLLVVGQQRHFTKTIAVKPKTDSRRAIVKMLGSALGTQLPRGVNRSLIETKLRKDFHWQRCCLCRNGLASYFEAH
jgi:hypothetical protein